MATAIKTLVTLDEYRLMDDGDVPTELVRGEVVEVPPPTFNHGVYCGNVAERLFAWNPLRSKGLVIPNDTGFVVERDPDTLRGPDVMFISKERIPAGGFRGDWLEDPPDLIVEVRSPSQSWKEMVDKVGQYLQAGVREVWILNPPRQTVHVYRPGADTEPAVLDRTAELTTDVLPGFRCTVGDLFVTV